MGKKKTDLWILPLVQVHTDRINLLERSIKVCLEVPLRTQCFSDMTHSTMFRMQFDRFKVLDILSVEEHVSDSSCFLVYLEWDSGEDDSFGDDSRWVGREEGAHCD